MPLLVICHVGQQVDLWAHAELLDVPVIILVGVDYTLLESQMELVELQPKEGGALRSHRAQGLELAHLNVRLLLLLPALPFANYSHRPGLEVGVLECHRFEFRLHWLLSLVAVEELCKSFNDAEGSPFCAWCLAIIAGLGEQ